MRAVALGAGNMGRFAIATLLRNDSLEELIVADRDERRTREFVDSLGDARLRYQRIDVSDHDTVVALMREGDVVMNTVGPFFEFGAPAVRAAIESKTPYLDINDDYGPTAEVLELAPVAREAGVLIVVGLGASPGISNVLARMACDELDEVDHVQTVWGTANGVLRRRPARWLRPEDIDVPADKVHWMMSCSGLVPVWRDGQLTEVAPVRTSEYVFFPEGTGVFRVVGHPEPITIPRFIPKVRSCSNLAGRSPEEIECLLGLAEQINSGQLTLEDAAREFMFRRDVRVSERPASQIDLGPLLGNGIYASARGRRGDAAILVGYGTRRHPEGGMEAWTGAPLAIGAAMVLAGEIDAVGVLAPEACINPDSFFARYAEVCSEKTTAADVLYRIEIALGS